MFTLKAFTQSLGSGCWSVAKSSLCDSVNPWPSAYQASLSFTISWSLLKLKFIESVILPNHLILCCPFSSCPQSFLSSGFFPMNWLFAIRWPKNWNFSFSISPFNEYSGLISLRTNWFDLCCPRDSQQSSWAQLESINSSVPSIFYGPTLMSIHDYQKKS